MKGKASPTGPRPFNEIEREFQQVSAQAANAQYKVYVHKKELEQLNKRLVEINAEAGNRQKLDADTKAELAKQQQAVVPTPNAQQDKPLDLTKSGAV